jgi:type II secretory pathway pseudopilin PulG
MRAHTGGRERGFSLLEMGAALALVLSVAGALLWRLSYYQEAAEQACVEYTANTLKLALQLHIGDQLARQRVVDYAALARENPVSWLETPMPGYRGEPGPVEAKRLPRGSWYFDRDRRELVYLPLRDAYLTADGSGEKRVRFQARPVLGEGGTGPVVAVQFGPLQPYRWMTGNSR